MASVNRLRSLLEGTFWQGVSRLVQEGLIRWLAASQGEEADCVVVQIDLRANEAMQPMSIDVERMTEKAGPPPVVGASQEDDHSVWIALQVETPMFGKGATTWRGFDACHTAISRSRDVLGRSLAQSADRNVFESRPDLGLPTAVVALDGRLKTGLVRRRKDRRYAQTQAQPDHASDGIGVLPRTMEAIVVVELCIGGKPYRTPVLYQGIDHHLRAYGLGGPGDGQTAMQRYPRQNGHMGPTTNCQAFDRIETVQFGLCCRNRRKIPASWRRWTTNSSTAIQDTMTPQNPADRGNREQRCDPAGFRFASNSRSAKLSQRAVVLQPTADGQHLLFARTFRTLRSMGSRGMIVPIDTIQPLALSTLKPTLHGAKRNAEANRYGTPGGSTPHCSYNLPSSLGGAVFEPLQVTPGVSGLVSQQCDSTASPSLGSTFGLAGGRNSSRATPSFRSAPRPSPGFLHK